MLKMLLAATVLGCGVNAFAAMPKSLDGHYTCENGKVVIIETYKGADGIDYARFGGDMKLQGTDKDVSCMDHPQSISFGGMDVTVHFICKTDRLTAAVNIKKLADKTDLSVNTSFIKVSENGLKVVVSMTGKSQGEDFSPALKHLEVNCSK